MNKAQLDLLVVSAQSGNVKTFNLLCEYIYPHLFRFALKQCQDKDVANDAVHDVLLKLPSTLKSLSDPRAFKAWVFKSIKWRVIDVLRKSNRHINNRVDEFDFEAIEQEATEENDHNFLLHFISELQEIDRDTVYLFYLEEMSLEEISHVLSTPIGTLKSRLNRARKQLKEKLIRYEDQQADSSAKVIQMRGN